VEIQYASLSSGFALLRCQPAGQSVSWHVGEFIVRAETNFNSRRIGGQLSLLYPGERGQSGVRSIIIQGNRLTLTAKTHEMGEDHERRLVWERATASR
jgi:hypothetical protein